MGNSKKKWGKEWYDYDPDEVVNRFTEKEQTDFCTEFSFTDIDDYLTEHALFEETVTSATGASEEWYEENVTQQWNKEESVGKSKNKNKNSYGTSSYSGGSSTWTPTHGNSGVGYQTSFINKKQCPIHDGLDIMIRWEDDKTKQVWELAGAQGDKIKIDSNLKLVIDLAGLFKPSDGNKDVAFRVPKDSSTTDYGVHGDWFNQMESLSNLVIKPPPVLRVQNPDMGIPPVGYDFWVKLFAYLPPGRTVVCCHGGHGRTGTALAALLIVSSLDMTAKEAIEFVRSRHCDNAIESVKQEDYLEEIVRQRDQDKKTGQKGKGN